MASGGAEQLQPGDEHGTWRQCHLRMPCSTAGTRPARLASCRWAVDCALPDNLCVLGADGRQVEVGVGDGLEQVPAELRKEVRQQLEALSKISAGALKPPKGR